MARTKQKLIHLHSTTPLTVDRANAVNMAVGEIAVQAAASKEDSSLWILTANSDNVAQFPSIDKVKSLISGATSTDISTLKNNVKELQGTVSGYTSTNTVKAAIEGVQSDLQGKISAINGLIGEGFSSQSTIASQLEAVKSTADTAKSTADTNKTNISSIKNALGTLTGATAVPNAINAAKTTITTSDTGFIRIASSTDTGDGHINYSITANDIASASALTALTTTVGTHTTDINALKGLHAAGGHNGYSTVAEEVAAGIAKVVDGAPEKFDTLKEIAEWIGTDTTGAAQMATDITELKATVSGYTSGNTVKSAIDTVNNNIKTINDKIGTGFTATTVTEAVAKSKTTITTGETGGVKVEIDTTPTSDGHTNYKISGVGLATTGTVSDLSAKVDTLETNLSNEVANREKGDNEIKGLIGTGFSSANTVAQAVAKAKTTITTESDGFIHIASATTSDGHINYTITDTGIASATDLSTLDGAAVKSGEINVDNQKFTGAFASNKLTFNLSTLVIDCGEY